MALDLLRALVEQQRDRRRRFRDHAHAAIDDGVLHEAFAREGAVVARAPDRFAQRCKRDEAVARDGLLIGASGTSAAPASRVATRSVLIQRRKASGTIIIVVALMLRECASGAASWPGTSGMNRTMLTCPLR